MEELFPETKKLKSQSLEARKRIASKIPLRYKPKTKDSSKVKVYDCFSFLNEVALLQLRLRWLKPVVDYFVIAEGTYYFTGSKRDSLQFSMDMVDEDMRDRIIYLPLDEVPIIIPGEQSRSAILNDRRLKAHLVKGLVNATDEDIVIMSDLDEFPLQEVIRYFDSERNDVAYLASVLSYLELNSLIAQKPIRSKEDDIIFALW